MRVFKQRELHVKGFPAIEKFKTNGSKLFDSLQLHELLSFGITFVFIVRRGCFRVIIGRELDFLIGGPRV
jgi:hypothetical protein